MTVILAAGTFPRKGTRGARLLSEARRIVACDGAANVCRRRLGRVPDVVVGDFDSVRGRPIAHEIVHVADQDTNDLTKALNLCAARRWKDVVIVGASGRREDHLIGNVFRALAAGVPLVTDYGTFYPVFGKRVFRAPRGTPVSVFAPDVRSRLSSKGLEWPLDGVRFENLYCATLNRTTAARFAISASRPVSVFIAERV